VLTMWKRHTVPHVDVRCADGPIYVERVDGQVQKYPDHTRITFVTTGAPAAPYRYEGYVAGGPGRTNGPLKPC